MPVPQTPVAGISPSDAELGFKPSSAPPLDPSVSQFVAAPIVDRYRSTASSAGMSYGTTAVAAVAKPRAAVRRHRPKPPDVAMGGPEKMEGKVVANLDSIGSASTPAPAATPPVMANPNGANAVVYFPGDAIALSAAAKLQVRATAEQFRSAGGQGYVRVVGHSSSRTANMSAARHLEIIFKKSQDRANAVARELIRAGVPADQVLVEAVGDTQPVFYESMPKGEDGNRRAEIFVQG
jgi:outer membrane protein OmpA-like peptidoglycan-associated protein